MNHAPQPSPENITFRTEKRANGWFILERWSWSTLKIDHGPFKEEQVASKMSELRAATERFLKEAADQARADFKRLMQ